MRRIPALQDLCFSDGRAFVDSETLAWLRWRRRQHGQHRPRQAFAELREELVAQLDSDGVETVLLRFTQDKQGHSESPRQRAYAAVIAADLLASRGLSDWPKTSTQQIAITLRAACP